MSDPETDDNEEKPTQPTSDVIWRALRLLNNFRLAFSTALLLIFSFLGADFPIGREHPLLFEVVLVAYMIFCVLNVGTIHLQRPSFLTQLILQTCIDILAIACLTLASGGVSSGVAMFLAIPIISAGLIVGGRLSFFLAALAALAILLQQIFAQVLYDLPITTYTQTGTLGLTLFAIAFLGHVLARRARESEALAQQQSIDLANLSKLNEYIIQHIESGIIVVDHESRVRLMNEAAWVLLGMPVKGKGEQLIIFSDKLAEQHSKWLANPRFKTEIFHITGASDVYPRFTRLGVGDNAATIILLEDSSIMHQQTQTVKLAALGRLTASIAHEIRNPLGAISHASQLLQESPKLDRADRRLTQIIRENTVRMNAIIENVMQLSRRGNAEPKDIELKPWLEKFVEEFVGAHKLEVASVKIGIDPEDTTIQFDPSHLHQILTNLCENGIKHGIKTNTKVELELRGGATRESKGPFLDVIDNGPGIDPEIVQQIFEPFFTTETSGTGLGLYIAQELCEVNQGRLEYLPIPTGGSCFRISFYNPKQRN
jgi:two-component system sensor histidine kinase PilS (NtrC family)